MFSVALYARLLPGSSVLVPVRQYDLNPDVVSCTFTSALPGGYGDLQIGFQRTMHVTGESATLLEDAADIPALAHVQLWNGSHLCFEGRVIRRRRGTATPTFGAVGYGLSALTDDVITSNDTYVQTAGAVLRQVLAQRAPLLRVGTISDTLVRHALADFKGQRPADVVNNLLKEGGSYGAIWDYFAYEDRAVQFVPRITPTVPDYHIAYEPETVTWDDDFSTLYDGVVVSYTDLDTGVATSTGRVAAAVPRVGRTEAVSAGTLRATSAATYAQTYLSAASIPQYGIQVTRAGGRGLETPGGVEVPPWQVRAGQWVSVADQGPQIIIRTQYDALSGALVCDVGQPPPVGANLIRQLQTVSGHVVRGTNVATGARA